MIESRRRLEQRRLQGSGGFTLIELLVVIVILGILAGVVVFAVSGVTDKGAKSADAIDARIVRTAEEAYYAKNGVYTDAPGLKAAGLLTAIPTLHNVVVAADQKSYSMPCTDAAACSQLTVGFTQDVYVLTGAKAALGAYPLNTGIFETLLRLDENYNVVPSLALSYELIPASTPRTDAGGTPLANPYPGVDTWRFHLRPNVKFHNGTPFNATAVKVGLFDRILGPASQGGSIKAGGPANTTAPTAESAQVVDDTCTTNTNCTIDFTPYVENLRVPQQIVHPNNAVSAPGTIQGSAAGGGFQAVGTGPFKFVSYTPGSSLVVTRNPDYWGTPALLKGITFKFFPDATARRLALQAGTVDFIFDAPRSDVNLLTSGGFTVAKSGVGTYDALYLNKIPTAAYTQGSGCEAQTGVNGCHDLLADVRVRKAVNYAIDRQALVNGPLSGQATTDQTFVAPLAISPYQSMITGYPFDLAQANTLLDQAGWTSPRQADGTRTRADGRALELTLISGFPDAASNEPMPDYLKGVLAAVGIRVIIVKIAASSEYSGAGSTMALGKGDMWLEQGNQNDANPAFITFVLYTGPGFASASTYPARFAPAPEYPTFNTQTQQTFTDPNLDNVRLETATAFKDAIENAAVLAPLAGIFRIYAMNSSVKGFVAHPAFLHVQWAGVSRVQ
ncbi:MAG TPA: ABC transporter substrate-binding protein [Acidimicrobiales bacterium]|nr:ABC transporter substrate-binding protein [Acidimicrobiales bacterium]